MPDLEDDSDRYLIWLGEIYTFEGEILPLCAACPYIVSTPEI